MSTAPQLSWPDPDGQSLDPTTASFLAYHDGNPQVYCTLRDLAREWRRNGKPKCGIELLWNVCRWRLSMEIVGDEQFELNNNYKSFYSRALMFFEPELKGLFDLRRAPEADRWIAQFQGEVAA